MELLILRHGQSTNNALQDPERRVCDPPLTELGRRQAEALAHAVADAGIRRLYCSPMQRALQTTRPISNALALEAEIWVGLHEHGGVFLEHNGVIVGYPGIRRSQITSEFPGYAIPAEVTEDGWWRGEKESLEACRVRAQRVAGQLGSLVGCEERVAIVTHGGFSDALLKALLKQGDGRGYYYHHDNAAITSVVFNEDGYLHLRYLNRVHHLPSALISA